MSLEIFKNLIGAKTENTETEAVEAEAVEAVFPNPLPEADEYNRRTFESWFTYRVFKSFPSDETKDAWNTARTAQDSAKTAFKAVAPEKASLREYRKEHETVEGIEITDEHLNALGISDRYDGPMVLPVDFSLPAVVAKRLQHGEKAAKMEGRSPAEDMSLTALEGCGPKTAEALIAAGYDTITAVQQTPASKLAEVPGVGLKTASKWSVVEDVVEESEPEPEPEPETEEGATCGKPKKDGKPCGWKIDRSPCPHHSEDSEDESPAPEPVAEAAPEADSKDARAEAVLKMLEAGFTKEEINAVFRD